MFFVSLGLVSETYVSICYTYKHMEGFRRWAFWRRTQYVSGVLVFTVASIFLVYYANFYAAPTCFDGVQNGTEGGVDCDGTCVRICSVTAIAPQVKWVKSFKIVDGQYNAVAYIENINRDAATPELPYTFRLYDDKGLITERSGVTVLPPNSAYPIFEGRIVIDKDRVPTRTEIELGTVELWLPATVGRDQFRTIDFELQNTDTRPRLMVEVENTALTEAREVEVVATIFDRSGEAVTASQTFVDVFPARTTQNITFTWPGSIAKTVRSCEVPSDIMLVLDRSGSMAADGGDPPEPLESAKRSAAEFVALMRDTSQLGILSYATTPTTPIEQTLTTDIAALQNGLNAVTLGTDGVQYTDMGEAFKVATAELLSARHRPDARKVLIFFTDGDVTRPFNPTTGAIDRIFAGNYALEEAAKAKAQDVTIYTIGFGDFFATSSAALTRDVDLIRNLASEPELFYTAPTIDELGQVYQKIATSLCEEGPARIEVVTKTITNFAPLQ